MPLAVGVWGAAFGFRPLQGAGGGAFSPRSSDREAGTAAHVCLLASRPHRPCAVSLPASFMLGREVGAEKRVWFIAGSTAPLLKIT